MPPFSDAHEEPQDSWEDIPVKQFEPGQFPKAPIDFDTLKKRLWQRFVLSAAIYLLLLWWASPEGLRYGASGILIGGFFLWSHMVATDRLKQTAPKAGHKLGGPIQIVFSLIRLPFLAYLIVMLGDFQAKGVAVVLCGFLTYKVGLVVETLVQSWRGLTQTNRPKP